MQRSTNTSSTITPLHQFMRKCGSAAQLIQFIKEVGEEQAALYAITLDDKKGLPIHVAAKLEYPEREEEEIYRILIGLTNKYATRMSFREPVNLGMLTTQFLFTPGSVQQKALEIACYVTNLARSLIWQSSTHSSSDGIDLPNLKALESKFVDAHDLARKNATRVIMESPDFQFDEIKENVVSLKAKLPPDLFERFLEARAKVYIETGLANCGDICLIARYFLGLYFKHEMQTQGINADIYQLRNADHAFLIIRVGNASPLVLDEQTIICDVLNGDIFPGSAAKNKLKHFVPCKITRFDKDYIYNFYVPYDPAKHSLEKLYDENNIILRYGHAEEDNFIKDFIKQIVNPKEYVWFCEFLEDNIIEALNDNLITREEIIPFTNRVSALANIFQRDDIIEILSKKLISLTELTMLDDASIHQQLEQASLRLRQSIWIANQRFSLLAGFRNQMTEDPPVAQLPQADRPFSFLTQSK